MQLERDRLGAAQAEIIIDFVAHGEFGLARDQLVDALSDLDLTPLEHTRSLLARVGGMT